LGNKKEEEMPKGKILKATINGKMWEKGNLWFAEAEKLPIAGFGKSPEEAISSASVAMYAYLKSCSEDKELGRMIQHYGIMLEEESPEYRFKFEAPVRGQESDLVPA
jgi:hypothetical protein